MKKCKFCNSKINKIKVVNFKFIKKNNFFYNCQYCKIEINPKKYNEKIYVYEKRNINFSGKKNIIYYLKSFFLFFFYLKIKISIITYLLKIFINKFKKFLELFKILLKIRINFSLIRFTHL